MEVVESTWEHMGADWRGWEYMGVDGSKWECMKLMGADGSGWGDGSIWDVMEAEAEGAETIEIGLEQAPFFCF